MLRRDEAGEIGSHRGEPAGRDDARLERLDDADHARVVAAGWVGEVR
jgi:hypothetical protein